MMQLQDLRSRMSIEQMKARQETCATRRQGHEDHARACAKLISVLERERLGIMARKIG